MTEGGESETPLTPEEEAEVARLLTQAGGPLRMPEEVAARLAGVLADLQSERPAEPEADVVELRSRRRWSRALLAAAAVVVGGYAVGTVATQGTLSGSEDSLSAGDAGSAEGARDSGAPQYESGGGDGEAAKDRAGLSGPEEAGERSTDTMMGGTVRLRSDRLQAGVRRALAVLEASPTAGMSRDLQADQTCTSPQPGGGAQLLPVRYDGDAAVLVAARERRGTVEVTIWSCAGEELDSTVVRP